MNAYTYGEQYFKKANPGNNITLFYDENGSVDLPLIESSFSYFTVEPVTGENMWRLEPEKLNAVHYDYVIAMENLSGTLTPVSKIYFSEELLAEIFPEYILPTDEFPIFEIDGKYIIQFSASILLEEAIITRTPKSPRKPLRTPNRVVRATNRLGETGVLFTMFISSDGAKLERAYQQITELDARELVLFIETKDKDNIFGTVMRIKTGSGVGESEREIPWAEAAKIPRFFGFEVEEGNLRRLIKRHYQNRLDGKENTLYIILKKQGELIEIPVGFTLSFPINALNTLIDEVTQTFRLDEKRWNHTLKGYSPLIPLPINGKVDLSLAKKEFSEATDKLATGLDALNRAMIAAPFLRPQLEPKLKFLHRVFTKELPNLVDRILEEAGENLVNSHHFYNALLVGILNSIIDLTTGILQIISLMLQLYEAELGAGKQLAENPTSFLSLWMELLENGLEIFTNLLTKENLTALVLFQQKILVKVAESGIDLIQNIEIDEIKIPYSHVGYYSGFIIGFVLEEILIALATGGTGNIAQAMGASLQGYSQIMKGTVKMTKRGALELKGSLDDFMDLMNQLRKSSKNLKTLLNDLEKWVDELFEGLGLKTISKTELKAIDDAIEELGIKITVPKNTLNVAESVSKLENIIQALKNKIPPKHFNPEKNALKELGIKLPVSKNGKGLSVDFADTKYLYPAKGNQKNIVRIKLTGERKLDKKLAYKLSDVKPNKNYTWHHLDDYDFISNTCTMQLVEKKIHEATYPHFGSVKLVEEFLNFIYKQ